LLDDRRERELSRPQNIRHDKVGDSKAIRREPLTFAQQPLDLGKTFVHPVFQAVISLACYCQEPPRHSDHLDRVEREGHPL
jgi:hypothetical protein